MMVDDIKWLLERNGYTVESIAICGRAICGKAISGRERTDRSIAVYKRNVPPVNDDLIAIISMDGAPSGHGNALLDRPTLTVISQSVDVEESRRRLKEIHDILMKQVPFDAPDGTHYYAARAMGTGQYERKTSSGPVYVHTAVFEISHTTAAFEPSNVNLEDGENIDMIASYIERITGQRCYRGQMPPVEGVAYALIQTGGGASDARTDAPCLSDQVNFDLMVRGPDIAETDRLAQDLQDKLHLTRHVGRIVSIRTSAPVYRRENTKGPDHIFTIPMVTTMERI